MQTAMVIVMFPFMVHLKDSVLDILLFSCLIRFQFRRCYCYPLLHFLNYYLQFFIFYPISIFQLFLHCFVINLFFTPSIQLSFLSFWLLRLSYFCIKIKFPSHCTSSCFQQPTWWGDVFSCNITPYFIYHLRFTFQFFSLIIA